MCPNLDATSAPPLPTCDDLHVAAELDVRLRTPTTLVVNAQLEFAVPTPHPAHNAPFAVPITPVELALVIPRSHCRGERPRLAALQDAAQAAVARALRGALPPGLGRVLTPVAGQLHLVTEFEAA
ncbi:hypothetical protein [Roseateles sp. BYS87W]|uniref:Uncharacterized protein n=1 Tax=Pelomonas baiyunensis TaxID=3299026 RepID=A0ABW7GV59_9BURK